MSILEQTVKCPICGEPYKIYPFMSGDQSACPSCRERAEENMRKGRGPDKKWTRGLTNHIQGV